MENNKYLLIVFCLFACTKPMNRMGRETESELLPKIKQGNIEAYYDLKILYLDRIPGEFIPIAKFMVDSIEYAPANLDIISSYFEKYYCPVEDTINLSKMNEFDRKNFLKYYEKAKLNKVAGIENYNFKEE